MAFEPKPHQVLTDLILEVFRLNGALLATGDDLVRDLGLTSARWQVLGAVASSAVAMPVAHLARNMRLTRQAVQRVVDDLVGVGFVRLEDNPHHRRAKLVSLTEQGESLYDQAMARQRGWAEAVLDGLSLTALGDATDALREVRRRLDEQQPNCDGQ
ncbi:MarR family winged helix-turn-helix transcriptional regulator [Aurantimonas sp. HBX-1]|uniref:MarR family winged helix-turn-helix transcriptional regulator n=1 Tax=Aurantimonas sp. HBX-1 TaxID=2906072 RepID=UPI001F2A4999|nr:MarR family transcriptional regulator [Aurantimonas sp. HBX-1]UIJ72624.1 MarR family transcriptional regulator [Aurantimonas sp. HBX-1]